MTEIFMEGISVVTLSGLVPDIHAKHSAKKVHFLIRYIKLHPSH